tara:strand:+ start:1103 stop:1537 length:435 start_codon:yes stop_codon:yes gene_type:complete
MGNYLGIDYGTKRIGLAYSDELGVALPIGAIPGVELDGCWEALAEQIEQRGINQIVLGYPIQMDGKLGRRAKEVDEFAKQLVNRFGLSVSRVDERLTSFAAEESLGKQAKSKKGRASGRIDATSACLILKDFLSLPNESGSGKS